MNVSVLGIDEKELTLLSARSAGKGVEILRSETVPVEGSDLRAALGKIQSPDRHVILVVPRAQAILRDFELPAGSPDEIVQMVRFQVEKELPLPPDQLRYSFVETDREDGHVRVQVAAVPVGTLQPALDALAASGFRVDAVTVSTFGLANLVAGRGRPVVVFCPSAHAAEIFVFERGTVSLSRSASISSEGSASEVAETEIQRTILAWQARGEDREKPDTIFATSRKNLGLNGELLSRDEVVWDSRTPALAGVCLGAVAKWAPLLDLLHPPLAAKRLKIPRAYRIAALAVITVALAAFFSQKILSDKRKELEGLRKELKKVEPEVNQVKRKDSNTHLARQWRENRFPWAYFFVDLHKTKLKKEQLNLTGVTVGDKGGVTITGKASSPEIYESFREELERLPYLRNVRSGGPLTPISEGPYRNKFTLKAELKQD